MGSFVVCPRRKETEVMKEKHFFQRRKCCPMMQIGVLGINHKFGKLCFRERFALVFESVFEKKKSSVENYSHVLLVTCNRTEVYFSSDNLQRIYEYLQREVCLRLHLSKSMLYSHFGYECFKHLSRVTAGLDSVIFAETEIQGQVKKAYARASNARSLSKELHFLFQKSFQIGKSVRSLLNFQREKYGYEEAIFYAGKKLWKDFEQCKTLFVGASEVNRGILRGFVTRGIEHVTVCNRTEDYGIEFANREGAYFLPWKSLTFWHHYDLIVFGTKSPLPLLSLKDVPPYGIGKKLIIDLSVPRNVDTDLKKYSQIHLMSMDEINFILEKNKKRKDREIFSAEKLIESFVEKLMFSYHAREIRAKKYCE